MKLHLEVDGKVFDFDMRASWFRAICKLCAAGIYAGMVAAVAQICGMPGLGLVAVVTILAGAGYLMLV